MGQTAVLGGCGVNGMRAGSMPTKLLCPLEQCSSTGGSRTRGGPRVVSKEPASWEDSTLFIFWCCVAAGFKVSSSHFFTSILEHKTKNYTFCLYFSKSLFCLIGMYEIVMGRGFAVPERLRNTAVGIIEWTKLRSGSIKQFICLFLYYNFVAIAGFIYKEQSWILFLHNLWLSLCIYYYQNCHLQN
jgi:hypothetical protein